MDENIAISDFQKDMDFFGIAGNGLKRRAAVSKAQQWKDAVPNEQKALQFWLRAEATFRQIQVAFEARGGGGGGGGVAAAQPAIWRLWSIWNSTPKRISMKLQQSAKGTL